MAEDAALDLAVAPPAVVLLAGLQGSGKTTTAAKLARMLVRERGKKPLLVSCDVYRPAAIEQLRTLAGRDRRRFLSFGNRAEGRWPSRSPRSITRGSTITTCCSSTLRGVWRSTRP